MKTRNITGPVVIQILKIVMYKQITYPAQFAQYLPKEYTTIQKWIDSVIRKHTRITNRVGSDLIHTHEQMGGMGEARVEDIVNTEKLLMLLQMPNGSKKMQLKSHWGL